MVSEYKCEHLRLEDGEDCECEVMHCGDICFHHCEVDVCLQRVIGFDGVHHERVGVQLISERDKSTGRQVKAFIEDYRKSHREHSGNKDINWWMTRTCEAKAALHDAELGGWNVV